MLRPADLRKRAGLDHPALGVQRRRQQRRARSPQRLKRVLRPPVHQ
jgi:hypothetical protein